MLRSKPGGRGYMSSQMLDNKSISQRFSKSLLLLFLLYFDVFCFVCFFVVFFGFFLLFFLLFLRLLSKHGSCRCGFYGFWKVEGFCVFVLVSRKQMVPDGSVDDGGA